MYEVGVTTHFSAAHRLAGYDGPCAGAHGHNWEVEVFIRGSELDDLGMLVDFRDVKSTLSEILSELDHRDLNTLEAFAKDKERFARFEREARIVAQLNHPNIAAIYGLEERDGVHFLVLEYVPGETLADSIARGALTPEETLDIFEQIAKASLNDGSHTYNPEDVTIKDLIAVLKKAYS